MPSGSAYNRCSHPKYRSQDGQLGTIAASCTASAGCGALARPGQICPNVMARGVPSPVASTAGSELGAGSDASRLCQPKPTPTASSTGTCMMSMAPLVEPTSMPLGQKKRSSGRRVRAQPGRVQPQRAPLRGGEWPVTHPGVNARATARGAGFPTMDGGWAGQARGTWPPQPPPAPYHGGSRIPPPADSARCSPAWAPDDHPASAQRRSHRPMPSSDLSSPEPH
jgi:hypothetical protein